ncbi:Oidioi.mRNA.OKI2018_I69.chr1.g3050.t1.cds [Oikopleura dioica]|uniref:Adenosine deaminase n=1 Tax=Oikopleura dioica TaxID=34765 RepID=A0ABN7SUP7_OIKDI|nr:Oidioi.mRNA.OKI2018_I69.chr1.g3050.t1.cds [Oikopleura dioica]
MPFQRNSLKEEDRCKLYKWPKVELHVHLEGVVRLETIVDLQREARAKGPEDFAKMMGPFSESWENMSELRSLVVIEEGDKDQSLLLFLERFKFFMGLIQGRKDAIYRVTYEFIEDLYQQRVEYAELRFCPMLLASCKLEPHFKSSGSMTPDDVIVVVKQAINDAYEDYGVKCRLILANVVGLWEYALPIIDLATRHPDIVVGIDVAGYENGHIYKTKKEKLFITAFNKAKELGIHRTAHAGEAGGPSSVKNALLYLNAERIGHGYHMIEDPVLLDYIKDKNIHVECCLTSCCKIGGFWNEKWDEHPIKKFFDSDVNCSLSTDDPTIFQNNLQMEYQKCQKRFKVSTNKLIESNLNAAKASFLPDDEKENLVKSLEKQYALISFDSF